MTSIKVTQFSEEWRAAWLFGKTIWFPVSLAIDWSEILHV
jgi:hypothetical protein